MTGTSVSSQGAVGRTAPQPRALVDLPDLVRFSVLALGPPDIADLGNRVDPDRVQVLEAVGGFTDGPGTPWQWGPSPGRAHGAGRRDPTLRILLGLVRAGSGRARRAESQSTCEDCFTRRLPEQSWLRRRPP
jgi:hypothetical protein